MRKPFLILVLLLVGLASFSQKKNKPAVIETDRFAGLDTAFERILKEWHAAGFAVAVVEKNKVIYAKGFGYRDNEKKLPVTPNTMFAIGSCTKAFTASLMGLLQKDGKVNYDVPVRNYLPDLRFYNDEMNTGVMLRDLMTHRTGLPRHDYSWYLFTSSSRDSLLKRIQYMEPTAHVRERFQYNNFMYFLQGMVAEKVTGKSWEQNVGDDIFKPLSMVSSGFSIHDLEKSSDASLGYGLKKDSIIKKTEYHEMDAMGPCGSINSNVLDMANWVTAWINGGKFNGKQVLPAGYVNEAMSSQMVMAPGMPTKEKSDMQFANYGFGWMLSSYKSHYRVEHGGNIDGFSASTCFFPTDSIGIVVLSNQNGSVVPSLVRNLVADRLLNLPYFDWSTDLKRSADKAKMAAGQAEKTRASNQKMHTTPSHSLQDYEGIYTNAGYGTFDISVVNDSLFARVNKDLLWLHHYHFDVFEVFEKKPGEAIDTTEKSPIHFQFHMNEAGDIVSMTQPLEASLLPIIFTKSARPKEINKDELQKYAGDYDLGGAFAKVYVKDGKTLYVVVPGQPDYELIPVDKNKFAFKAISGFYLDFEVNEQGESIALTFRQPNGNFRGVRKKP